MPERIRLLGGRAELGVSGGGNPSGTLIENWNGSSWSIVPSPSPTGPGVGERCCRA